MGGKGSRRFAGMRGRAKLPPGAQPLGGTGSMAIDATGRPGTGAGSGSLRVLIVDDEETDAAVLAYELGRRVGLLQTRWAEGGDRMFAEIEAWQPDIVLTDAHMPRFDLRDALARLRARWPLLPVVVVSGLVGDEVAAQLIKAGANDFVAKPGGARLALVVERELRDARERAEKAALQAQLQRQQAKFEQVLEHLPVGVWLLDAGGNVLRCNAAGAAIWEGVRYVGPDGYGAYKGWWADSGRAIEPNEWAGARAIRQGQTSTDERIEIETFGGRRKVILHSAAPLRDADGTLQGAFVVEQDITGLHRTEQRLRRAERTLRGLSRRLLDAQEQERRWIAQELHDDIGQAIAAMRLHLARIAEHSGTGRAAELAAEALASSEQLGQRLRQICLGLRPLELDDFGLLAALRSLIAPLTRPGLAVTLDADGDERRYPPALETAAFRIAQEALSNALRHSGASAIALRVVLGADQLAITVDDDGCGFDPEPASAGARGQRFGLAGMEERARAVGGQLTLRSAPGQGCTVDARFSVAAAEPPGDTMSAPLEAR